MALNTAKETTRPGLFDWRGQLKRSAIFPWGRKYNLGGRTSFLLDELGEFLQGHVLDVGAGSAAPACKKQLGDRYDALDIGESYTFKMNRLDPLAPEFVADLEHDPLPFGDRSYDTVICTGVLEHLDNIYNTYDELFRVARKYVIIELPNNWVRLVGSFLIGRHIAHRAGYGLPPQPKPVGRRHKYFFNFEEACDFLVGRMPGGFKVSRFEATFVSLTEGLLYGFPKSGELYWAQRGSLREYLQSHPYSGVFRWLAVKTLFKTLKFLDDLLSALVWGWGSRVRYYNLFCYEVWMVFERVGAAGDEGR